MRFATFLEKKLSVEKITIRKLSRETGVSRGSLYRWLAGDNYPEPEQVMALTRVLDLSNPEKTVMLQAWLKDKNLSAIVTMYINETLIVPIN